LGSTDVHAQRDRAGRTERSVRDPALRSDDADALEKYVQELSRLADEAATLEVLVVPRSFTDDRNAGAGIAVRRHDAAAA